MASDGGPDADRSAAQPEERKTETTLTTRIRINIPGSRPIPPVVVRQPVGESEGPDDKGPDTEVPAPRATASAGLAEPAAPAGEKTSDWFAPRKSGPPTGGPGGGATNGAGVPGSSGAPGAGGAGAPGGARPSTGAGTGAGAPGGARPGAGRPGGVVGSMSVPGGSRPGGAGGSRPGGGTNGAGLPGATGGPVAPGHGGGTGSFDVTEALAAGPRPGTGGAEPRRDDLPYFSENGNGNGNGSAGGNGSGGPNAQNGQSPYGGPNSESPYGSQGGQNSYGGFNGPNGPGGPGGPQGPSGPTGGPVTGDGPRVPPISNGPQVSPISNGPQAFGGEPFSGPGAPGPGPRTNLGPGGGLSDDTAILTPQKPAPEPGTPGFGNPDNVSGHTVTSGIPVVPPGAQNGPFGPGAHADGPLPHTPPKLPETASQDAPAASSKKKKKKKGRSKLTLVGVLVVLVGIGAYGAGLLMNRSDVPKGTYVLGVDIGGGTRDDAVKKLDDAFGKRVDAALKLSVDGDTVSLTPDQAGLQLDEQATVAAAAQSDYNPISVIGSLFGNHRVVDPVMPVDEEKLTAALQDAAGGSGSATDGTIVFKNGKAVAVYGKAGKGINVAQSTTAVEEAYRSQVETGTSAAVKLPTTTKQPTVSNAEVDRMMKEFAEPAMSEIVTIQTDSAHSIQFGALSLPKILGFKAVDGKLVEKYDLKALKAAYGTTFDGVKIDGASGKRDVLPEDVASALGKALRAKTAAERTQVIDTTPN